jgi:aspartate/glutamate racemase
MTKLLEEAIAAVSKLPDAQQDAIAKLILEELASEQRWKETFANSQNQLDRIAEEALAELNADKFSF